MSYVMFHCNCTESIESAQVFTQEKWSFCDRGQSRSYQIKSMLAVDFIITIHSMIQRNVNIEPIEGFNLTSFVQLLDCWFHNQAGCWVAGGC